MAAPAPQTRQWIITSTKGLAESPGLTSIPPNYIFSTHPRADLPVSSSDDGASLSVPTVDFSLLTSTNHDQRSRAVRELGKACEEWGFFMVVNHGVPENDMRKMIEACEGFFDLTDDEKKEFQGKHVLDPIRCGSSFNVKVDKVLYWRDFLKVFVHPVFHSPNKPPSFSETLLNYSGRVRGVARALVRGVAESLGLEVNHVEKELGLESGLQHVAANYYPPCPQPELAIGLPPHSDHGLLTLLIQNQIGGLQVQHKGKWVNVNPLPNSFLVNTGDHMEIMSNGKYKRAIHRAVVNNRATRISIATVLGPALDTIVRPLPELVTREGDSPAYRGMKYADYLQGQQSTSLDGKSYLEHTRVLSNQSS